MKVAIDLGTTYSVVYVVGRGVVWREPSAIAVNRQEERVIAYGTRARGMLGRVPPSVEVIRPLRDGVIANFEAAREMLKHFIAVATKPRWFPKRCQIVICVPHGATQVEMESLRREGLAAGASRVDLVKEPFAAALGAGLEIHHPRGHLVVDIGGGTTESTAMSLNNIVHCESLRMAGNAMDQAIEEHFRLNHQFAIGEATAERLKIEHGSVLPDHDGSSIEVKGLNVRTGRPEGLRLGRHEIHEALEPILLNIIDAIRRTVAMLPPELVGDVAEHTTALVGGGALLPGWTHRLHTDLGMPVRVAEDPLMAVTRGLIRILENPVEFQDLVDNSEYQPELAG